MIDISNNLKVYTLSIVKIITPQLLKLGRFFIYKAVKCSITLKFETEMQHHFESLYLYLHIEIFISK